VAQAPDHTYEAYLARIDIQATAIRTTSARNMPTATRKLAVDATAPTEERSSYPR